MCIRDRRWGALSRRIIIFCFTAEFKKTTSGSGRITDATVRPLSGSGRIVKIPMSYALHLSREVFGLPIQHRETCRPQSFTRRPTIFNNELRDAAATEKMWRARLFSRWPCRVERSTGRHACCFWLCFLGSDWRLTILVLLLTFVDYCCLLLMTLVLHLCSPCNRCTINFYMMMMMISKAVCVTQEVCIAWCRTGAYYTAKLTFFHDFPIKVWGSYCTSVRIIFEIVRVILFHFRRGSMLK